MNGYRLMTAAGTEDEMPDPIEMLTKDHREVESLFEQYREQRSAALAEKICTELTVHTAVEEKEVYPVLGADVDGGKKLQNHAEKEHGEVKEMILGIGRAGYASAEAERLMEQVMDAVTHHVEEEEGEVFPAMRSQLSDQEMTDLGERAAAAKKQLLEEAKSAGPLLELTKDQLYEMAKDKGLEGRSEMNREQLISALRAAS